jgi:hypothetical protein
MYTGPNTVTDGLVLALDAANKKSYPGTGTAVKDLSGNSDSTLTNGTTYDSTFGGAFDFDGTNDKITTPITAANWADVAFTIQLWTSDCTVNDSVFEMGHDGSDNNFGFTGFYWSINNRIFFYWKTLNGLGGGIYITVPHNRTAPNNICVTFTGIGGTNLGTLRNNTTIYFNGVSYSISTGGKCSFTINIYIIIRWSTISFKW